MSDRIPTELYISANIRKCGVENIPVYVQHKGDPQSGTILLKILDSDFKCRLFGQMRDMDGALKWFDRTETGPVAEASADQQIKSAVKRDPDLWVVEIETRDGLNPFEGEIIQM